MSSPLPEPQVTEFDTEHGIATVAWSPLGEGEEISDPAIDEIGERLGRSPAQVILRWHLDRGIVATPKSVTPARIRSNLELDFKLERRPRQDRCARPRRGRPNGTAPRHLGLDARGPHSLVHRQNVSLGVLFAAVGCVPGQRGAEAARRGEASGPLGSGARGSAGRGCLG